MTGLLERGAKGLVVVNVRRGDEGCEDGDCLPRDCRLMERVVFTLENGTDSTVWAAVAGTV